MFTASLVRTPVVYLSVQLRPFSFSPLWLRPQGKIIVVARGKGERESVRGRLSKSRWERAIIWPRRSKSGTATTPDFPPSSTLSGGWRGRAGPFSPTWCWFLRFISVPFVFYYSYMYIVRIFCCAVWMHKCFSNLVIREMCLFFKIESTYNTGHPICYDLRLLILFSAPKKRKKKEKGEKTPLTFWWWHFLQASSHGGWVSHAFIQKNGIGSVPTNVTKRAPVPRNRATHTDRRRSNEVFPTHFGNKRQCTHLSLSFWFFCVFSRTMRKTFIWFSEQTFQKMRFFLVKNAKCRS